MESLPRAEHTSWQNGLRSQMRRPAEFVGTAQPKASAYSTASGRRSSIHRVQGHRLLPVTGPHRLRIRLGVLFLKPAGEGIATDPENAADRPFRSAFLVGLENALLFFFGVCIRVGVENEVRPAVFAVVLLGSAGAVAVFDEVGASTFAARVSRLDHGPN